MYMTDKQVNTNPIVSGPRISIFDKKGQASFNKINTGPKIQLNKNKVNLPQFRINQHKGA